VVTAKDGDFYLAVGNDRQFSSLARALDLPALADDSRFASNSLRVANRAELLSILELRFIDRGVREWLDVLARHDIPAGPIQSVPEVFRDAQVLHREMMVQVEHPTAGPILMVGIPVKLDSTPGGVLCHPPRFGEHTEEVLRQAGYSDEQIAELLSDGVVRSMSAR
jgi:crotonobetainyl-CoA:carnitine CoA-transferase CaiB-like acyl-CoA transferase